MGKVSAMRPYSIFTPPFDPTSGGIRVMYGLHGWLLAKGQISFINATYDNKDFVAVYPEIAHGNPTGADNVVRYILNKPGVMASQGVPGPTTFEKTDKLWVFSQIYNTVGVDNFHIMFLPIINMHLFKDLKGKRPSTCVFGDKSGFGDKHPKDAIKINRELAQDQQKLMEVLNTCRVMYSYDKLSAMFEVARLCGCRIVVLDKFDKSLKSYEPGWYGVSWEQEDSKKFNSDWFRDSYYSLVKVFENDSLPRFIQETQ
jgi:hypothetical protein